MPAAEHPGDARRRLLSLTRLRRAGATAGHTNRAPWRPRPPEVPVVRADSAVCSRRSVPTVVETPVRGRGRGRLPLWLVARWVFLPFGQSAGSLAGVTETGLRERKRAATGQALAEAAFELAKERGLHGFVIDDVAERAGYSRRTFANHYSCKEAAVASVAYSGLDAAGDALEELSGGVPLLDAIHAVLQLQLTRGTLSRMREVIRLSREFPSLEPYVHNVQYRMRLEAEQRLRSVAADRYPPTYVSLLFGALYGMVSSALEGLVEVRLPGDRSSEPGSMDFEQFLEVAFTHLRTGF